MRKSKDYIEFEDIYNNETLNIFSDASMDPQNRRGCYGAVVVYKDTIIDQAFYTRENTTNNECEAFGLRLALYFALGYRYKFKNINIFSDSLININCIKSYQKYSAKPIYDKSNSIIDYQLYNDKTKSFIVNQAIINECIYGYIELCNDININFSLLYQPGHVYDNLKYTNRFCNKYVSNNNDTLIPTESYIVYISKYNEYVDNFTRNTLKEMAYRDRRNRVYYTCPIHFMPIGTPKEYYQKEMY